MRKLVTLIPAAFLVALLATPVPTLAQLGTGTPKGPMSMTTEPAPSR